MNQCHFDLIIKDAPISCSIRPICLIKVINALGLNGILTLEDAETSFLNHPGWNKMLRLKFLECKALPEQQRIGSYSNALSVYCPP